MCTGAFIYVGAFIICFVGQMKEQYNCEKYINTLRGKKPAL